MVAKGRQKKKALSIVELIFVRLLAPALTPQTMGRELVRTAGPSHLPDTGTRADPCRHPPPPPSHPHTHFEHARTYAHTANTITQNTGGGGRVRERATG
jgi:hypothetical protein